MDAQQLRIQPFICNMMISLPSCDPLQRLQVDSSLCCFCQAMAATISR